MSKVWIARATHELACDALDPGGELAIADTTIVLDHVIGEAKL